MSKNDITGDNIKTKPSHQYSENFDSIFRKSSANHLLKDDDFGFNVEDNDNEILHNTYTDSIDTTKTNRDN